MQRPKQRWQIVLQCALYIEITSLLNEFVAVEKAMATCRANRPKFTGFQKCVPSIFVQQLKKIDRFLL